MKKILRKLRPTKQKLEVKQLAKKLNIKGDMQIRLGKSWFSDAMDELEKDKK